MNGSKSCGFIARFLHKVTHYMRTIKGGLTQLRRVKGVIEIVFIPSITGGISCNKDARMLLPCPPKLCGLGIPKFTQSCQVKYKFSVKLAERLRTKIISRIPQYDACDSLLAIKNEI